MNTPSKDRLESAPKRASWGCVRQVRALTKPRALQLPVCTRPEKKALAAGKAPACLERTWHTTRPPTLEPLCAWVKPHDLPHLHPTPLFGTCLEEVLNQPPRPAPSREKLAEPTEIPPFPESLPAPRVETFPLPRPPLTRPTRPPRPNGPSNPQRVPLPQPAQATLALLTHHAGGQTVARFFRETHPPRKDFPRTAALHAPRTAETLPPAHKLSIPWQNRLAHRIRKAYWNLPGASQTSMSLTPTPSNSDENLPLDPAAWIAHALAISPLGITAPRALLQRLTENPPPAPPPHSPSETSAPRPPAELLRSPAERTASGVPNWDAPFSKTPRGEAPTPLLPPPPGAQQGFYPQAGSLPMPAAGQPNFRPPLAPPLAATNAPTLLPPQEVFDAPTPFASATSRQLAKADETRLVEEDLDVLATKIKRILDEEARRHGIQVP